MLSRHLQPSQKQVTIIMCNSSSHNLGNSTYNYKMHLQYLIFRMSSVNVFESFGCVRFVEHTAGRRHTTGSEKKKNNSQIYASAQLCFDIIWCNHSKMLLCFFKLKFSRLQFWSVNSPSQRYFAVAIYSIALSFAKIIRFSKSFQSVLCCVGANSSQAVF